MEARSIIYVDSGGNATIHLVRSNAGAASIQAQILAVSNADYSEFWEGTVNVNGSPAPVFAQYPSGGQIAQLTFACADGTAALLRIPAPKVGIFLADQQTIDPTAITALIAACVGSLVSTTGSLATGYQSGIITPVR